MHPSRSRAKSTVAAIAIVALLTAFFAWIGVGLARSALDPDRIAREMYLNGIGFGLNEVETQTLVGISAVVLLLLCALTTVLVIGLVARRASVRHAAIGTFVVFAAVALPLSVAEVLSGDAEPTAAVGLLVAALDVSVVALLLRPETLSEFERAEAERDRARAARRADRIARRARASEPG